MGTNISPGDENEIRRQLADEWFTEPTTVSNESMSIDQYLAQVQMDGAKAVHLEGKEVNVKNDDDDTSNLVTTKDYLLNWFSKYTDYFKFTLIIFVLLMVLIWNEFPGVLECFGTLLLAMLIDALVRESWLRLARKETKKSD